MAQEAAARDLLKITKHRTPKSGPMQSSHSTLQRDVYRTHVLKGPMNCAKKPDGMPQPRCPGDILRACMERRAVGSAVLAVEEA